MSWMSRSANPSPDNLLKLLGRFDANLADAFQQLLDEDAGRLNDDLAGLVARRNGIAHGLNEGLGAKRALELYGVALQTADWFIASLNPDAAQESLRKAPARLTGSS